MSHFLPFPPKALEERKVSPSTGYGTGMEHWWTHSWLPRVKGKNLGYPTCCRGVYLNLPCKTAEAANLSDTTSGLLLISVARDSVP